MKTTYPIVLVHGICPFDRLLNPFLRSNGPREERFQYFHHIPGALREHGYEVFYARVAWAASCDRRAHDLFEQIRLFTRDFKRRPRVHLIAHSMGGLDARNMIHLYRLEDRVASLTTIGTPHLGTSLADWGTRRLGWVLSAGSAFGLDLSGFHDLTRAACARMNRRLAAFEEQCGVRYQTVAGARPYELIRPIFKPSFRLIQREEGENDGLVALRSAVWNPRYLFRRIDADHLNMIGWWGRRDAFRGLNRNTFRENMNRLYLDIADGLGD